MGDGHPESVEDEKQMGERQLKEGTSAPAVGGTRAETVHTTEPQRDASEGPAAGEGAGGSKHDGRD